MRKIFRFSAFVILFSLLTGFFYVFYARVTDDSLGIVPNMIRSQTPTPFPPIVYSPLNPKIVGMWKLSNTGAWENAIIAFSENGFFTISGGLSVGYESGTYFFTADKNLMLYSWYPDLPPVEIEIDFQKDDQMILLVNIPNEPKGTTYIAEKVK